MAFDIDKTIKNIIKNPTLSKPFFARTPLVMRSAPKSSSQHAPKSLADETPIYWVYKFTIDTNKGRKK